MGIRDKSMKIEEKIILVAVLLLITATFLYLAIEIPENFIHWVGFGIFIVVLIGGIYFALTSSKEDMEIRANLTFTEVHPAKSMGRWIPVVLLIILIAVSIQFLLHHILPILGK